MKDACDCLSTWEELLIGNGPLLYVMDHSS